MADPQSVVQASSAYWTTVAQVAGVFAIPLVLETRRTVARWRNTQKTVRRIQGLYYALAAYVIVQTIAIALIRIYTPRDDRFGYTLSYFGIAFLSIGLVAFPVLQYFASANADWNEIIARFMPWSKWRGQRRLYRDQQKQFNVAVTNALSNYERIQKLIDETRVDLKDTKIKISNAESALHLIGPQNKRDVRRESAPEYLGIQREFRREMKKILRRARKTKSAVERTLITGDEVAAQFDKNAGNQKMTYFSPTFLKALEARVGELSDDARDDIFKPPATIEFENAVKIVAESLKSVPGDSA